MTTLLTEKDVFLLLFTVLRINMTLKVLYYGFISIIALFTLSKYLGNKDDTSINKARQKYGLLCLCYFCCCMFNVSIGFSNSDFWIHVFYYCSIFTKVLSFTLLIEVIAELTGYSKESGLTVAKMSSFYLLFGNINLVISLIMGQGKLGFSPYGIYSLSRFHILEIFLTIYYILILFGLFYILYLYSENCKKQREVYSFKLILGSVFVIFVSMVIEICGFCVISVFIPSVLVAYGLVIIFLDYVISYNRSIEYNKNDYIKELSPTNNKSVFIMDDELNIIMRNKHLDVMIENFRDSFENKHLLDIFEIDDADKKLLKTYLGNEPLIIKATYKKIEEDGVLVVDNIYDKFVQHFAYVVTTYSNENYIKEFGELPHTDAVEIENENAPEDYKLEAFDIDDNSHRALLVDGLIGMLENANRLYQNNEKIMFEFNLKGIKKCASKLADGSIVELCERIESTLKYCDLEAIDFLMLELVRQTELLKMMH